VSDIKLTPYWILSEAEQRSDTALYNASLATPYQGHYASIKTKHLPPPNWIHAPCI